VEHPDALVGEIGLDKAAKDKVGTGKVYPMELQLPVFEKQLDIAMKMKRHVSIHAVRCYGALFDVLKDRFDFNLSSNVCLHSYGGSVVCFSLLFKRKLLSSLTG
jgi:Tat protein secretion system quality control protein TatD with DNase activity